MINMFGWAPVYETQNVYASAAVTSIWYDMIILSEKV